MTMERLPDEPEKYHRVLQEYAALGPGRPGVRAFVEAQPPGGPSWRACYREATRWHWRERLADYDRATAGQAPGPPPQTRAPPAAPPPSAQAPGQSHTDRELEETLRLIAMDAGQRGSARVQAAVTALALTGRVAPRRPSREELREEQRAAARERDEQANTLAGRLGPDDSMVLLLRLAHPEFRLAIVTADGAPVDPDSL